VEKISELETAGKLTGIIDERGKFIYISRDEMSNVALFIKQRVWSHRNASFAIDYHLILVC